MYLVCAVLVKCQKRAPDALAVELHVEPPFPMGADSETWALWKITRIFNP